MTIMSVATAWTILHIFNWTVVGYFVALNSTYLLTTLYAFKSLKRYALRLQTLDVRDLIRLAGTPPVTLLAPAFNEEKSCVQSVRALLTLDYPDYEIIFINDGSTDSTLKKLKEEFRLERRSRAPVSTLNTEPVRGIYQSRTNPILWVLDKENGGKSDSLNAGLNYCHTSLFCAIDADTLLEPDALVRVVRPFLEDDRTITVGGIIRIANGCDIREGRVRDVKLPRNFLAKMQVLEYLRAFLSGRMGWDALGSTLIVSGAFGMFKRSVVIEAGGYSHLTVGEDMELVVRLHKLCRQKKIPYKIQFVPDPVAWTECPEDLKTLSRQRDRWQRGLVESLSQHREMLFNPRYGRIGLFAFPYFYILEMLGPVIEFCGYIVFTVFLLLGLAHPLFTVTFLLLAFVLGIVLSIGAVSLEELTFRRYPRFKELLFLFLLSIVDGIGYRQLNSWFRVKGTFSALLRHKTWGKMKRKGF